MQVDLVVSKAINNYRVITLPTAPMVFCDAERGCGSA